MHVHKNELEVSRCMKVNSICSMQCVNQLANNWTLISQNFLINPTFYVGIKSNEIFFQIRKERLELYFT